MSSPVIISIKCPLHLIRFYESLCGNQPIEFNSAVKRNYNKFLNHYLEIPPLGHKEHPDGEDIMKIRLPYFRDKDVRSYTYLPPSREKLFVHVLDNFFKITFYYEAFQLIDFFTGERKAKKIIIENFIETYNLPPECFDMLKKDFDRMLSTRRQRKFVNKHKGSSEDAHMPG